MSKEQILADFEEKVLDFSDLFQERSFFDLVEVLYETQDIPPYHALVQDSEFEVFELLEEEGFETKRIREIYRSHDDHIVYSMAHKIAEDSGDFFDEYEYTFIPEEVGRCIHDREFFVGEFISNYSGEDIARLFYLGNRLNLGEEIEKGLRMFLPTIDLDEMDEEELEKTLTGLAKGGLAEFEELSNRISGLIAEGEKLADELLAKMKNPNEVARIVKELL